MIKIWFFFLWVSILNSTSIVWSKSHSTSTPAETHEFHVTANANYRCYAGYNGKKLTDDRTKEVCDNKRSDALIVDKTVSIKIVDEPDPENSKDLAGSWDEEIKFKGRKFVIAITLFKNISSNAYRIRVVTKDDEPVARNTDVFAQMKTVSEMNILSIGYNTVGKKEEISYWTQVMPSVKK